MEKKIKKRISTNSRVLHELLTKYKNTFYALSELVTNSIQAKATEIKINIDVSDIYIHKSIKNILSNE